MDHVDANTRSRIMRAVRSNDTQPELAVRKIVHALGFRYRLRDTLLPGKPDLVFPSRHKVLFVHGCFWHRHKGCRYTTSPKTHKAFWNAKFEANVRRDRSAVRKLRRLGWGVMTVWQCQLKRPERLGERLSWGIHLAPPHPSVSERCITVREAARLHSYPDWFRFHVTKWHGFRQIGNSVPPRLARAVAAQLLDAMQIEPVPLGGALPLGDRRLLTMTVTEAARYYSVSNHVVGRRLRPDHFVTTDFVSSGHISVEFCNIPG